MSGNCSTNWHPLGLSTVFSVGLHIALLAVLLAFPSSSPPQLRLELGDVCINVRLVSAGEPNLGSGYADSGDETGDGQLPLPMPTTTEPSRSIATALPPTAMNDEATFLVTDAIDRLPSRVFPERTFERDRELEVAAPDIPLDAASRDAVQPVPTRSDRVDKNDLGAPMNRPTAASESAPGTGTPAGAASTGTAAGVRSGVSLSGQKPPTYPAEAQRRGLEGEVMLWLKVLSDGSVAEVKVHHSSGHDLLDDAAMRWAKSLHFVPARQDGKAVSADALLPVRYRLSG